MSTNTGEAPLQGITSPVAAKVKLGQNTASPGPISQAISGRARASVPLPQETAWAAPAKAASWSSNARTSGPMT